MTATDLGFALTVPGSEVPLVLAGEELVGAGRRFGRATAGIWDLLPEERRTELDRFSRDYARVREREGRAATPPEIRRLPDTDTDHPLAAMWAQRRASFDRLSTFLAARQIDGHAAGLRVVDIGAGSGWLAARLAAAGWSAAAVDVTVAGGDGLAAAVHHDADLLLLRADMGALPFAAASVELAVFNASLHYAADIDRALHEARRVVGPAGLVVVVDSPVFVDPDAGAQMVAEFGDHARRTLGVDAAASAGPGYVTWDQVGAHGLVEVDPPRGGAVRAVASLRRLRGRLRAGREIASRPLLVAEVSFDHRPGRQTAPMPRSTP